jgi:putative inorganic carbon (HCO3(-)) transporter
LGFAVTFFALVVMLATLALAQSRGAWLGLGAGVLLMLAGLGRWGRGLAALALAACAWGAWQLGQPGLDDVLFGGQSLAGATSVTLAGRMEVWSRAIYGIQDFPFTGMGLNTFRHLVQTLYPLFLVPPGYDIAHAHNQWLQAALDLGIPGLVAYLAVWLAAAIMLRRAYLQAEDTRLRAAALGLGGGLAAYFVYGLTDVVSLGAKPGLGLWLLLALCVSVAQRAEINRGAGEA